MREENKHKKSKRDRRTTHTGVRIPKDRADAMEAFWNKCDSVAQVADKFGHARSTVYALMRRYDWVGARSRTQDKRETHVAHEMAKEDISNLKLALALRNKAMKVLLDVEHNLTPSVKEAVALLRLVGELEGDVPPEGATGINVLKLITGGTSDNLTDDEISHRLTQYGAIYARINKKSKAGHE